MLLSVFSAHSDHDNIQQRLEDVEASLQQHVALASELAEQNEVLRLREEQHLMELNRHRQAAREAQEALDRPPSPPTPLPPASMGLPSRPPDLQDSSADYNAATPQANRDAILRAICGRSTRALLRATLTGWRSHCDKAIMMRNMHKALMRPTCSNAVAAARSLPVCAMAPAVEPTLPAAMPSPSTSEVPRATSTTLMASRTTVARLRWRLALCGVMRRLQPRQTTTVVVQQTRLPPPSQVGLAAGGIRGGIGNPWGDNETPVADPANPPPAQGSNPASSALAALQTLPPPSAPPPSAEPAAVWLPIPASAGPPAAAIAAPTAAATAAATVAAATQPEKPSHVGQRLLSWLVPDGSPSDPAALQVRLQHVRTENQYLRERIQMVESQMQPLLTELSEKRLLLQCAYVLTHKALEGSAETPPSLSTESVSAWARSGADQIARPREELPSTEPVEVDTAMETVLEETLRRNQKLEKALADAGARQNPSNT